MIQAGDVLEQYRLTEKIGVGAYGTVFAAENTVTGKKYALKIVPMESIAGQRELRALKVCRELVHPNLLKIHHAGILGDYLYYTMDLADGKLAGMNLDPAALRKAAIEIADALAVLHGAGLLHRDIKPDNLFYREDRAILGDIGLLTAADNASLSGTPGFLSPKILQDGSPPDEGTDLYALAKSFYCLLSHNGPSQYPHYRGPVTEDASALLNAVFDVCDDRGTIRTAAAFRDRLRQKRTKTVPRLLAAGIALLLLLIAGGIVCFFCFRAEPQAEITVPSPQEEQWEKEANAAALKKYPLLDGGKRTTFKDEVSRHLFVEEYLEKKRAAQPKKKR